MFIHIPKTAGSAIKRDPNYMTKLTWPMKEHLPSKYYKGLVEMMSRCGEATSEGHARWRDLTPETQTSYSFVAILRNPWDRVVSRYTFYQIFVKNNKQTNPTYTKKSFEAFLEEREEFGSLPYYWHKAARGWYPQVGHVTDKEGNLKVACLRYENLQEEAPEYFKTSQPVEYRNVSNGERLENRRGITGRRDYKEFYTPKTRQLIADWYREDIEMFGFDFDTGATKNTWKLL